jgi:hypothetical protein
MQKQQLKYLVKLLPICLIFLISSLNIKGQDTTRIKNTKNSIHLDGSTLLFIGMYSVNYERTLLNSNHFKMEINAGIGGWYLVYLPYQYYGKSIPLSINILIGSGNHYFETDLGVRYTVFNTRKGSDTNISPFFPEFDIGYRVRQNGNREGFIFRSFIGLNGIGGGIGYAF